MIVQLETWILNTLQTLYDAWGWWGVGILLIFENATGVTPSEIILGLAGWMLIEKHDLPASLIFLGGFYAAIGSALGASIPYWVARLGGRPLVHRLACWVRINPLHITHIENQFHKRGAWLVLFGRVIPGVRTLVSIPAGLARMPFHVFFAATFVGVYIWCVVFIGAGYLLGHEWRLVGAYLKQALPYLLGAGVLALALYLWLSRRFWTQTYAPSHSCED